MSAIACNHFWYNQTRHGEQAFDVGVDHGLPVVQVAFVFGFEPKGQTSVIHQHVDLLPGGGQALDGLTGCLPIAHVEGEGKYLGALRLQF